MIPCAIQYLTIRKEKDVRKINRLSTFYMGARNEYIGSGKDYVIYKNLDKLAVSPRQLSWASCLIHDFFGAEGEMEGCDEMTSLLPGLMTSQRFSKRSQRNITQYLNWTSKEKFLLC